MKQAAIPSTAAESVRIVHNAETDRDGSALVHLVAGGAGFLGSHLCERLLQAGHEVVCLDNLVTGRRRNVDALLQSPRFRFIECDVVRQLPALPRVDRVYHLASPASPPAYQRYPIETLLANSEGTRRLLELALRSGARFLFASTSEVYGDPMEHPQREDYRGNVSTTGPRSMYDEAKRYGEALTAAYAAGRGVNARIVRLFNTYGPRSRPDDGRMVPNFICQALRGAALTVHGDGSQTRSLCYASDTVEGIVRAMELPGTEGEVINLGNQREDSVLRYAELIRELTGSRSELRFVAHTVGDDPQRRRPNIDKARRLLDWEPCVQLEQGLATTIAYFRAVLEARERAPARVPAVL